MAGIFPTHSITNQTPPLAGINLYASDAVLVETFRRESGGAGDAALMAFGAVAGSEEMAEAARLANTTPPRLETHDAQGRRRDAVEFHPSYHALMKASCEAGLHSMVWQHLAGGGRKPAPHVYVERAALFYLAAEMEAGHCCPVTMTSAAVPALLGTPTVAAEWVPRILPRSYDPRLVAPGRKSAVTLGMGMTEVQGGTDVRANATQARAVGQGGAGGEYVVVGHKWFMSAPMSDAFVVLAQAPDGLTCFLMPRVLPDGTLNALRFQRLKDKLGNRSNASSEVEFHGAHAWALGEEGRGVATIIEMVTHTRLDCAVASAALMRQALSHAVHHALHRTVFQQKLADQPLMRHVLADLALDVEAATALSFRLARAFDRAADARAGAWRRLMTPVTKYWVCKIAAPVIAEAMECLGGNGYVEAGLMPRLYREAPVNSIWEGSGNVMALDVLRVLQRDPEAVEQVMAELADAARGDRHLVAAHEAVEEMLFEPRHLDIRARMLVEALATLAAGCILTAHAPADIGGAFVATRLWGRPRHTYGQGLDEPAIGALLGRARPGMDASAR